MDSSIQFKKSRLEIAFYLVCVVLACYAVPAAELSHLGRGVFIAALGGLIGLTVVQYRQGKYLSGGYRLTGAWLVAIESNAADESRKYQPKLLQRLPWCLSLELSDTDGSFRQIVWKDSLNPDDWRRFRAFLTELAPT